MTFLQGTADQIRSYGIHQFGQGNIDLYNRPLVKTPDGTATVRSMSFSDGTKEILVPTVSQDGALLTPQQAISEYNRTGQYLGKFDSIKKADQYGRALHLQQQRTYGSLLNL